MKTTTPLVLFIYKRPENLVNIANVLRHVKPSKIYIVADGPKNKEEAKLTSATRKRLEKLVDWPCKIKKNYAKGNLGLKERFSSGIDWVFKYEKSAIFLEDDCIPSISFFRFCDTMLKKYQDDKRIMTISGDNFQFGQNPINESYYFSRYPHVWGWATWKRAWDLYDRDLTDWPELKQGCLIESVTGGRVSSLFWRYIFDKMYLGRINTWDYQLTYASFKHHALNIIPSVNLVSNVGYGEHATNTKIKSRAMGQAAMETEFPLIHPKTVSANTRADHTTDRHVFLHPIGVISLIVKSLLKII